MTFCPGLQSCEVNRDFENRRKGEFDKHGRESARSLRFRGSRSNFDEAHSMGFREGCEQSGEGEEENEKRFDLPAVTSNVQSIMVAETGNGSTYSE